MEKDLIEQYKSETGRNATYRKGSSDYHTLDYVKWLESHLLKYEGGKEWTGEELSKFIRNLQESLAKCEAKVEKAITITVEDCENWVCFSKVRGHNCYACSMRKGYPFRGQPDNRCERFKLKQALKE